MYNYGDHEINYQIRFPPCDGLFFSFAYHKIILFEKKYDIKLVTLISMYHLKPLVSLTGSLEIKMQMYKLLFVLLCSDLLHNYFT